MQIEIVHGPGNAAAKVSLEAGEKLTTEGGAMIAMSGHLQVTTSTQQKGKKSLFKAAKRLLGGESFFLNHYESPGRPGEIWLSTAMPGDMQQLQLDGGPKIILQGGAFVACSEGVSMDTGWQGFKNMLSGEGLFWLSCSGTGSLVFNSFGAIYPIDVDGEYVVDSGHIVAFEETLDFKLSKAGSSWLHSIMGGEGLVCRFNGRGRVWCQSHQPHSFGASLTPHLKPA